MKTGNQFLARNLDLIGSAKASFPSKNILKGMLVKMEKNIMFVYDSVGVLEALKWMILNFCHCNLFFT